MWTASRPIFFPHPALQVLSAMIHFIGMTVIAHCWSRRVQHESLTYHGIRTMPWPRLCVLVMFQQAWLFLLASGIMTFGIGLEYSRAVCTAAIYVCIFLYCTAKFFVYAFLAEKVHIVWSPAVGGRRFESPVYLCCIVSVSLYCIVTTLMLGGPIHDVNDQGACVIGLKPLASIPLLVYDVYINFFLTFMFLWPLFRSKLMSPGIRRLAIRTLIAAIVALTTSTINIVVLIVMKGRELGWVNLGACGADIIVNSAAIFWVSGGKSEQTSSNGGAPTRGQNRRSKKPAGALHGGNAPAGGLAGGGLGSQISGNERNADSIYYKHSLHQDGPSSPLSPLPQHSFPRYNLESSDSENGGDGGGGGGRYGKRPPWYVRLFGAKEDTDERHLKISVTTVNEFERAAPIELQRRDDRDSKSDLETPHTPRDLALTQERGAQ